jgi:mRNA-degrading endonuclease toxin of MazEF toxin-antitoxin module
MVGGDTFLFRSIAAKHLWVVISDPAANPNDPVVIVSLVSYRPGIESTCLLHPDDHEFIKHKTAVSYRAVRMHPRGRLVALARRGELDMRGPMPPDVLDRIRAGAFASDHVRGEVRKVLADQGLSGD